MALKSNMNIVQQKNTGYSLISNLFQNSMNMKAFQAFSCNNIRQNGRAIAKYLPDNIGANFSKSLLPTSSPHLGTLHSNSKWSEYDQGHYRQASIVIHATDGFPLHALLREDVAENKCKIGNHGTHKS
jgi:hypothetical protein